MVVHLAYLLYKLRNMEINHWTKQKKEQKCLFNLKFCVLWDLLKRICPDHIVVFMHFIQAHSLNQRKRKLQPLFTIAYSQYVICMYIKIYHQRRKCLCVSVLFCLFCWIHVTFKTIIQLPNIFSRGSCIIVRLNQLFHIHPFQQRYII